MRRRPIIVLNLSFDEDGVDISFSRPADYRDNAGTGSPVSMAKIFNVQRDNPQYRDEIEEIEDKIMDLIIDISEDFAVAEPWEEKPKHRPSLDPDDEDG